MGVSTNAMLMYGYDLGGGDGPWKLHNIEEYDDFERPWINEDDGIFESAKKTLLAAAGFTETDYNVDGYFDRKRAAEAQVGVHFEGYCSDAYTAYVISARTITASRGDCLLVDFTIDPAWNEKLAHALKVLDLKPTQAEPRWLLASYWG
jgi:hypothetical protein